jgi:phosphocarrier protein HPr
MMPQSNANESISRELVITNKMGIHARPAAMFVKAASQFDADVFVEKDGERVNGKSIMGLMMLAAGPGSTLLIEVTGKDANQAFAELETLIANKFNEK